MATDSAVMARDTAMTAEAMERVVIGGDLAKLTAEQRMAYYGSVCESLNLNPLTKPFSFLVLNNRMVLYATRDATDQLRALRGISIDRVEHAVVDDLYVVTASGHDRAGRVDSATGAVSYAGLRGEAKANAMLKSETKAKRRLTLSLAGLGWLDESEVASIPNAASADVDLATGEIKRVAPATLKEQVAERRQAIAPTTSDASPAGEGDGVLPAAPSPAVEPEQCAGFDPEKGRCRREAGHDNNHRSTEGSWAP